MLTRPTVLIVGAGASKRFGFELGAELSHNIVSGLSPGSDPHHTLINHAGIRNDAIDAFRRRFQSASRYSIDAFLEGKEEETVRIGKTALAWRLMSKENEDTLFSFENNWLREMCAQLDTRFDSFGENRLSILTYNYERTIEHFLFSMLASQNSNERECVEVMKKIPIIHLHGRLGYLPWEGKPEKSRRYEPVVNADSLRISVENIKVIHEAEPDETDRDFKWAKELISAADQIVFLGFGYNETNLHRLGIEEFPDGKSVGTCFKMGGRAIDRAKAATRGKVALYPDSVDCIHAVAEHITWS